VNTIPPQRPHFVYFISVNPQTKTSAGTIFILKMNPWQSEDGSRYDHPKQEEEG
jgi:hypothetical protein